MEFYIYQVQEESLIHLFQWEITDLPEKKGNRLYSLFVMIKEKRQNSSRYPVTINSHISEWQKLNKSSQQFADNYLPTNN